MTSQEILCVDPDAPWKPCKFCGKMMKTCEAPKSTNDSYLCPLHRDGSECDDGTWVCESCFDEWWKQVHNNEHEII